jgi:hypothetical protein
MYLAVRDGLRALKKVDMDKLIASVKPFVAIVALCSGDNDGDCFYDPDRRVACP